MNDAFTTQLDYSNPATLKRWGNLLDVQAAMRQKASTMKASAPSSSSAGQQRKSDTAAPEAPYKRSWQANKGKGPIQSDRFTSKPGTRSYSVRSIHFQAWYQESLKQHNLCFHCVSRESTVHVSKDCPDRASPPGPKELEQRFPVRFSVRIPKGSSEGFLVAQTDFERLSGPHSLNNSDGDNLNKLDNLNLI